MLLRERERERARESELVFVRLIVLPSEKRTRCPFKLTDQLPNLSQASDVASANQSIFYIFWGSVFLVQFSPILFQG